MKRSKFKEVTAEPKPGEMLMVIRWDQNLGKYSHHMIGADASSSSIAGLLGQVASDFLKEFKDTFVEVNKIEDDNTTKLPWLTDPSDDSQSN